MGLLDFNPDLNDPKTQLLVSMGLSLLGGNPRTNKNFGADMAYAGSQGLGAYTNARQFQMQQQAMERQNRASDLQTLIGLQQSLYSSEFPRMVAEGANYKPSPQLDEVNKRINDLAMSPNLSGSIAKAPPPSDQTPAPLTGSGAPPTPTAPTLPASVASQYSPVVRPEFQAQGPMPQAQPSAQPSAMPTSVYGVPLPMFMAAGRAGPGATSFVNALVASRKPMNMRPGGTALTLDENGNPKPIFYAPKLDSGIQPTFGPNGQVSAAPIPGYAPSVAALAAAQSGGQAAGKNFFAPPTVFQTPGAPTAMTPSQAIQRATGVNPMDAFTQFITGPSLPQSPSAPQSQSKPTIPPEVLAADKSGVPFVATQAPGGPVQFQRPSSGGFTLQDQSESESQKKFGAEMGTQFADVFKQGAASVQAERSLSGMKALAQDFTPSKVQPLRSQLAQYAYAYIPGATEQDVNRWFGTNVGSIQALTSGAIAMAGKLTRQSDAQPSQLQFLKTLESMPMADRTGQGFQKIMDYLNSMHDYNIERMLFANQWVKTHNDQDVAGFEAAWTAKAKEMPFVWNTQGGIASPPSGPTSGQTSVRRYNPQTGKIE